MARESLCLGVDIGASSIKLCQLKKSSRGLTLERYAVASLPPETVIDGALMNSARVVQGLRELIDGQKVRRKQVAFAISGHSVIIKKIVLPQMTRKELEASVQWEAEQFIPFDIEDVYLDASIIGPSQAAFNQMDVVLVAAKKEFVNEYSSVVLEAGLDPVVCDVDAFAIEHAYSANYNLDAHPCVVLLNIGASKSNINILAHGTSGFTRDVPIGGNTFSEEIQKQLGVSHDEAEALKLQGQLSQQTQDALLGVAENLCAELQRCIDFFSATSTDASPSHVFLSGGSARLNFVTRAITERLALTVETVDPFRKVNVASFDQGFLASVAPAAAVAVGLALRAVGDG